MLGKCSGPHLGTEDQIAVLHETDLLWLQRKGGWNPDSTYIISTHGFVGFVLQPQGFSTTSLLSFSLDPRSLELGEPPAG